jgi:hypothetical protein
MWFGRWSWSESEFEVLVTNPELLDRLLAKQLAAPPEQLPLFAPPVPLTVWGVI